MAGDGPIVATADPFTNDAPGLMRGQIEMTTVSTRPTLVTAGEVRVQVRGVQPDDRLVVTAGGRDVSGAFTPVGSRPGQEPGIREGLVTGLALGATELAATATDGRYGSRRVTLTVVDHPIDGPVISGPHQEPFVCETAPSGLGPPTGADCDAPTQVAWYARNVLGQWTILANPYAPPPAGTQMISSGGRQVPFVVRVESAVINRSVTRIAVLDDPAGRGPGRSFAPTEWNHKLLYQFGESCGTGFHQGSNQASDVFGQITAVSTSNIAGPFLDLTGHLEEGWMYAESTLTTFGVSCNPLTSAETLMMVKEHIIDDYGDVDHTVGAGASGGAIQQYLAANNYPGLIDAGTPLFSFPDILTTAMTVTDCTLLNHVFAQTGGWTQAKQDAVTGEDDPGVCSDWQSLFAGDLNPSSCPGGIPPSEVYNATTNPNGVRCDLEDDDVNGLGRDASGHAELPLDNTGVQYGLDALRSGQITPAEFISLNQQVGGFDRDGHIVAARNQMTPAEAALLYGSGEITGRGALPDTPIIDQSIPVGDLVPALDIHQQVWPYTMRARLAASGDQASQAVWSGLGLPSDAIDVADEWLDQIDALQQSHPFESRAQLVAAARPAGAHDQCRVGAIGVDGLCENGVARAGDPRMVAGEPLRMDNIDCRLVPVTASDYPASVTAGDLQQIRALFPGGVCDYSSSAVGWSGHTATWLTVGATTLLPAPAAVPYPLVRSMVPAGSTPIPAPAPNPPGVATALNALIGPASVPGDTVTATTRTAKTIIDALP